MTFTRGQPGNPHPRTDHLLSGPAADRRNEARRRVAEERHARCKADAEAWMKRENVLRSTVRYMGELNPEYYRGIRLRAVRHLQSRGYGRGCIAQALGLARSTVREYQGRKRDGAAKGDGHGK